MGWEDVPTGYELSVQLGNADPAFDIAVVDGNRHSLLRVKTTWAPSVVWSRRKSGITFLDPRPKGDFCCIADFRMGVSDAVIYVVPTPVVQAAIDDARRDWLSKPRRDGKARKDSTDQRLHLNDRIDRHAYEDPRY